MVVFIGIVFPFVLAIVLYRIASAQRRDELEALGVTLPSATASSYLVPDRPY